MADVAGSAIESRSFTQPQLSTLARGLVVAGLVSEEQVRSVVARQSGQSLIRLLLEHKIVDDTRLATYLSQRFGVDLVDLEDCSLDPAVTRLVPTNLAKRHLAIPVSAEGHRIVVAMVDPTDVVARDDIRAVTRRDVQPVVASFSQISNAIERSQLNLRDSIDQSTRAMEAARETTGIEVREVVEEGPIIKLVNQTVVQAVLDRASDIHIEPLGDSVRIRFRIDGVLHEVARVESSLHAGLMTRIKLMAQLDISERRRPQDGRISASVEGKRVDLRVATLPTYLGEKVVIRVLDTGTGQLNLDELGFLPETLAAYAAAYSKPWGTILVTGPTGSGKSTTLYATLNKLNRVDRNIVTVEDPVEYQLSGISQVQVSAQAGLTFANALRSILRSDPDVILIGEIRDRETAEIAVEAALTGHLVLSSLHTNDAVSTPSRLFEMGVEPYLVASSLSAVVGQRLARRLCERCRVSVPLRREELTESGFVLASRELPERVWRPGPQGCERCSKTGYLGRIALHEVLTISETIERAIAGGGSTDEVRRIAVSEGMRPMRDVGLTHVLRGVTSIEEILRIVT
ncbi:MAG: GspE/PulE family protein [Ferrimicrobium sp.]